MLFAIVIGTVGGTLLAFFVSKWLLGAIATRFSSHVEQRKSIKVAGALFGAIALAPAIFLPVMSGLMGERYAGTVSEAMGLGEAGTPFVLGLGMVAATTLTVAVATALGAGMGFLASRSLYREPS
jgi:hypothetical protein